MAIAALAGIAIWATCNGDVFMVAAEEALHEIQTALEEGDPRANAWLEECEVLRVVCTPPEPDPGNSGMSLAQLKKQVDAARQNWMNYQNNPAMKNSMEEFRAFTDYQKLDQQHRAALRRW